MKKTNITSMIAAVFSFIVFEAAQAQAQAQEHGKTDNWESGPIAAEAEADLIKVHEGGCAPGHCSSSPTEDDVKRDEPSSPGGASGRISAP